LKLLNDGTRIFDGDLTERAGSSLAPDQYEVLCNGRDPDSADDPDTTGLLRGADGSLPGPSKTLTSWMERISAPVQVSRPGEEQIRPCPEDPGHPRSVVRAPAIKGSEALKTLGEQGINKVSDPLIDTSISPRLRSSG